MGIVRFAMGTCWVATCQQKGAVEPRPLVMLVQSAGPAQTCIISDAFPVPMPLAVMLTSSTTSPAQSAKLMSSGCKFAGRTMCGLPLSAYARGTTWLMVIEKSLPAPPLVAAC
jgi:hypothetical protein